MNKSLGLISAFIGGAIVGAGAAILFAPEKGEDLRKRIYEILRKRGIFCTEADVNVLVEQLAQNLDD